MPVIQRQGETIYFETHGTGPAVMFGHSLLCDGRMWEYVMPHFSGYQCINVDLRGHRYSTAHSPYTMEHLADDCLAIMNHLGLEKVIHCGLSMGAMTGMRLALRHPNRVAGLALIDTNDAVETTSKVIQYKLLATVYQHTGITNFLEKQIAPLMFGKTTMRNQQHLVTRFSERVRMHDPPHLSQAINAVVNRGSITHRLRELSCKAIILAGLEDKATPLCNAERMRSGIRNSELIGIAEAGHLSVQEQPDIIAPHLANFFASCSS